MQFTRSSGKRYYKRLFLVGVEGTRTECDYFSMFALILERSAFLPRFCGLRPCWERAIQRTGRARRAKRRSLHFARPSVRLMQKNRPR